VEKYLAASDVYLLPSYREGFGTAVIEAEAMGIPVIVTDIPGPTDAMKKDETGLVIKKGSALELYDAMEKLYNSKRLRTQMGAKASMFASDFFEQKTLFEKMLCDRLEMIEKKSS
jgi:glycosyltransferase involved in cell wall biosynthesis